jgi:hypothetical protein
VRVNSSIGVVPSDWVFRLVVTVTASALNSGARSWKLAAGSTGADISVCDSDWADPYPLLVITNATAAAIAPGTAMSVDCDLIDQSRTIHDATTGPVAGWTWDPTGSLQAWYSSVSRRILLSHDDVSTQLQTILAAVQKTF